MNQFHLVNVEPYTSEMYSALLQPSMQILEKYYVKYGKKPMSRENFLRSLIIAPIKGVGVGISRSFFTVAYRNIYRDYKDTESPRPPRDIFFIKYYINFHNYPRMLRGITTEMKVECPYQTTKSLISAFSKYVINIKSDHFLPSFAFTFTRAFMANLITATTVYPLTLSRNTDNNNEEILHKVIKRAGSGSAVHGLISGGMSIARSMMPSYKKMLRFAQFLTVG